MGKKILTGVVLGVLCLSFGSADAQEKSVYMTQMGHTFSRGVKNVISAPWEIPSTISQYDKKNDGNPRVFRNAAGFVDGFFRTVTRYSCAVWDMIFSTVPGQQEGIPLEPKAFF